MKKEAESGGPNAYHAQLGKTIGLMQQTLALTTQGQGADKANELRYLLAFLYHSAGRLPDACVFGEAAARWGKLKEPSTREAAMIALAAAQEAHQTQWGIAGEVGELDRMRSIAKVIAKRWPEDKQLDLIWLSLGQSYDKFNRPLDAGNAYVKVSDACEHYASAQMAAGSAFWQSYRQKANSRGDNSSLSERLQRARKHLAVGVKALAENKPTIALMAAKVSLARMAIVAGDLDAAETWLTESPASVIETVVLNKPADEQVQVDESFLRLVFETLISIRSHQGNVVGSKDAITLLATKLGKPGGQEIGRELLQLATGHLQRLLDSPVVNRQQYSQLSELIEPLKNYDSVLTASNVLWLGESWAKLAERAAAPDLAKECYRKAAMAFQLASTRSDFLATSLQSALLRQAQFLRLAGDLQQALPLLEKVLAESPNAFGLQIEAAETLQALALAADNPKQLLDAIDGPADSAIWGWKKLVTTLHGASEGSEKNRERLLQSQYNMYRCQLLVAQVTEDKTARTKQMNDLKRSLDRLIATTDSGNQPWYGKFQELAVQLQD